MKFMYPQFFALLAVLPLIVFLYIRGRNRQGAIRFSDIQVFKSFRPSARIRFRHVLIVLRILAIVALATALARPRSTLVREKVQTEGIDIMLTLDVSGSMEAKDIKPSTRLDAAKEVIGEFISNMRDNRLGLVVYGGKAFTQCPLTLDYNVLLSFLERVEIGIIEETNTAIGMALATAVNRLKDSKAKSRAIVLLTDGKNNAGQITPLTAADIAKTFKIKVYTIALGNENTPMIVKDPIFGERVARNPDGSIIFWELDEELLMEIALRTDGRFYRARDKEKLREIYNEIARLEKSKIKTEYVPRHREYFPIPLFVAVLIFLAEVFLKSAFFMKFP